MHLDDNRGRHAERDRRQQLVRDSKQRPERIDTAERVLHPLP